ncbi:hypothetical protein [Lysobacter terrae]
MNCIVYWGSEGFVLVPDCMVASLEAERRYGPLLRCGSLETEGLEPDLAQLIDKEVDLHSFAPLSAGQAMRLGYAPGRSLPLPDGFSWENPDEWDHGGALTLLYGQDPPVPVAIVEPASKRGGWKAITNCHKGWEFRGARVGASRAAALQFVTIWANSHAQSVRRDIAATLH